ncbi:unnamed protein product [Medioppia subpectinata]|uniref:Uncharacterized protein n=1 Tax=Medioppia subpectinata TaxID=1979941 RepID=A0A7R9KL94_9ACAR|nr:unnamed protein product [Medioppia subpectinata]CAG2105333.1 unnamed protein product [Medioppia subpectinata]
MEKEFLHVCLPYVWSLRSAIILKSLIALKRKYGETIEIIETITKDEYEYTSSGFSGVALTIVRILLVIVLTVLFIISAIDAIGDDIDVAGETHLIHDPDGHHLYGVTNSTRKEDHNFTHCMGCGDNDGRYLHGRGSYRHRLDQSISTMILVFALSGIFLPDFNLTLPEVSSNYYLLGLEIVAIVLSLLFVIILNRWGVKRRPAREKGVTFA